MYVPLHFLKDVVPRNQFDLTFVDRREATLNFRGPRFICIVIML